MIKRESGRDQKGVKTSRKSWHARKERTYKVKVKGEFTSDLETCLAAYHTLPSCLETGIMRLDINMLPDTALPYRIMRNSETAYYS